MKITFEGKQYTPKNKEKLQKAKDNIANVMEKLLMNEEDEEMFIMTLIGLKHYAESGIKTIGSEDILKNIDLEEIEREGEEIVNKINSFDRLDKELCRLENKEKRLEKENKALKELKADIKKDYRELLAKEQLLITQNREYIEVIKGLLPLAEHDLKEAEDYCGADTIREDVRELIKKAKEVVEKAKGVE